MKENQYDFWVNWRLGLINRELTQEEEKEIRCSEFAMHLLVPIPVADALIDKYGETVLENKVLLEMAAEALAVPFEPVVFQLQDVLKQKKIKNEESNVQKTK